MRPQFSLHAILLLTAYAAVLAAAIVDDDSYWMAIAIYALPVAFLIACGFAIFGRGRRRSFATGMVAGCLFYYGLLMIWPENSIAMPHEWIEAALPRSKAPDTFLGNIGQHFARSILLAVQCTLASGLLGGAIALWIYRRRLKTSI